MTTATLSKSSVRKAYWNGAYFLGELRRSWAHGLLYTLAFFFTMTVPMLSRLSDTIGKQYYTQEDFVSVKDIVGQFTIIDPLNNRFAEIEYGVYVVISMLIAVWAGIFAMVYLNRRVSAYFHHSLPLSREGILLVKSASALVNFLIALVLNLALTAIFYLQLPAVDDPGPLFLLFGYCLLSFIVILGFVLLLGTLCGTSVFHFLLVGLSFGLIPLYLFSIYALGDMYTVYLDIGYLTELALLKYTSPFLYLFAEIGEGGGLSLIGVILLLVFGALCFFGAILLIRRRPTEGAESPVVFRGVGAVLKYAVMAPAAVLLAIFFEDVFGGIFGLAFGFICGVVLSFMLMNVLLSRSARKMFRGAVGMVIFSVVLIGTSVAVCAGFNYRDMHALDEDRVKSISIRQYIGEENLFGNLSDPEVIELTSDFLEAYFSCITSGEPSVDYDEVITKADSVYTVSGEIAAESPDVITLTESEVKSLVSIPLKSIVLTQTTRYGISYTWRVHLDQFPELDALTTALCRAIAESKEFQESYIQLFDKGQNDVLLSRGTLEGKGTYEEINYNEVLEELRAQIGFDFFQQTVLGTVSVRINRRYYDLPVYESQAALIRYMGYENAEQWIDQEVEQWSARFGDIEIEEGYPSGFKCNADGTYLFRSIPYDYLDLILHNASNLGGNTFFLTRRSRDYLFQLHQYGETITFVDGKVPQEIIDLFG